MTFVWNEPVLHNVVSTGPLSFADHPGLVDSGSFTATFPSPGEYNFDCQVHPRMVGRVTAH